MIGYKDCFFTKTKPFGDLTEGFLSEVYPLDKEERKKWEIYEEDKKFLRAICLDSEYGLAVKCLADKLNI